MTVPRRRPPPLVGEPVTPRPAATVVLVREAQAELQILLTLRPSTMAFAAGMMVFPGGRVDDADTDARHAAIRELFEEAGILLAAGTSPDADALASARRGLLDGSKTLAHVVAELGVRLDLDALVPIARWVTPAAYARRFDARFFTARLPASAVATFVGDEVAGHRWTTAAGALEAMAAGEIEMWIPTSSTLQRMRGLTSFDELTSKLRTDETAWRAPVVERLAEDRIRVTCWTAGGAPGRTVETMVVGRREVTVIDPGDPSPEALAAIVAAAATLSADGRIVAIALISPDPYRTAGADELSERTGAQVFGPPGSQRELPFPVVELEVGFMIPTGDSAVRIGDPT